MSFDVVELALCADAPLNNKGKIDSHGKFILLALCKYANKDSLSCYPSYATLAKMVGCSRSTAIDKVNILIAQGIVMKRVRRFNPESGGKKNQTSMFDINVAELLSKIPEGELKKIAQTVSKATEKRGMGSPGAGLGSPGAGLGGSPGAGLGGSPGAGPESVSIESVKELKDLPIVPHGRKKLTSESFHPESVPVGMTMAQVDELIAHKKGLQKKVTEKSIKVTLNKINKCIEAGYTAEQCLDQMIADGWKGIAPDWLSNAGVKPITTVVQFAPSQQGNYRPDSRAAMSNPDVKRAVEIAKGLNY